MTISRVRPAGWPFSTQLTAAEITELDIRNAQTLDKTSAGDTLAGIVQTSGVGRVVESVVTGANANTSYAVGAGSVVVIPASLSADRTYTFSSTGAVAGDKVSIYMADGMDYVVTIVDGVTVSTLITIGTIADAKWCVLRYTAAGWVLHETSLRQRSNYFADVASLQAHTTHVDGDIAMLPNEGTFYFDAADAAASDIDYEIYKPTDILVADPGRWRKLDQPGAVSFLAVGNYPNNVNVTNLGTVATLCDTRTIAPAARRGVGVNMRLAIDFWAEFELDYSVVPALVETQIWGYVEVKKASAAAILSETFYIPGHNNFTAGVIMSNRLMNGYFENYLNGGNGTYDVKFYAARVDNGGTMTYCRFKRWGFKYQLVEVIA